MALLLLLCPLYHKNSQRDLLANLSLRPSIKAGHRLLLPSHTNNLHGRQSFLRDKKMVLLRCHLYLQVYEVR